MSTTIIKKLALFVMMTLTIAASASAQTQQQPPSTKVQANAGLYSFTLTQAPLPQVLQILYGEILREPYFLDDVVKNSLVSINFKNAHPEAFRAVLDAYLQSKGITRVVRGGVNLFVPTDKSGFVQNLEPEISLHEPQEHQNAETGAPESQAEDPATRIFDTLAGGHTQPQPHIQQDQSVYLYKPRFRQAPDLVKLASQIGRAVQVGDDVLILGTSQNIAVIRALFDQYDFERHGEVVVRATVAEYTSSDGDDAGIFGALRLLGSKFNLSIGESTSLTNFLSFKNTSIEAVLSSISTDSRFSIVNSSTLRVLSNKSGRLSIGQEVPILSSLTETSSGNVMQNVSYKTAGLQLEVKPVVIGDQVQAEITQIVSSFSVTNTSKIDSPTMLKREFTSNLVIPFGEVVVLGGLEEQRVTEATSRLFGIPLGRNRSDSKSSLFLVLQFQKV